MTDCLKCALRNLQRKKFRTSLTIMSIAIGVASVVLISTIGDVGKYAINQELDSLGIGSLIVRVDSQEEDTLELGEADLKSIQNDPAVASAIPVLLEYAQMTMRGLVANVAIWGVDAGASQVLSLQARYGSLLSGADVGSGANVCLVDTATASGFYGRENIVGKQLKLQLGGRSEDFTVVGVVDSGGNAMQSLIGDYLPMFVYIPYTTMQRVCGREGFDQIAVQVHDSAAVDAAADAIVERLERESGEKGAFSAENVAKQKDKLNHMMNLVTAILSVVAGISLVVAGLGIMTVMLVNVNERTREIGIKKSIGARRSVIMLEFLAETFTISAIGSIIGTACGLAIAAAGCLLLRMQLVVNIPMVVAAVAFSVVLGIVFGVYPSWVASNLRPVDALRYE